VLPAIQERLLRTTQRMLPDQSGESAALKTVLASFCFCEAGSVLGRVRELTGLWLTPPFNTSASSPNDGKGWRNRSQS
jgi:hypothetical protein